MKNLSKLLMVSLFAIGLAACGTAQNPATGYYNSSGQWVPGTGGVMQGGNACLSSAQQTLSFGFTAQGVRFNGNAGFYAGNLPASHPMSGQYGTVSVGGAMQNQMGAIQLQKQSQAGQLQISINPQGGTASGMIQISPMALQQTGIMNYLYSNQGYGGYNTGYNATPSICVTSVALDVIYSASSSMYGQQSTGFINSALVYLYLNNGQVVQTPIQFF